MAEDGYPFQLESKLPPELKKAVSEIPNQKFDNKAPNPTLDDNKKRWLIVGICLHDIISPELRSFIEPIIQRLYNSLKSTDQIDTNNVPLAPSVQCKTFRYGLDYKTINNNSGLRKNQYDYKIQSHIDLSKTILPAHMAKYTGFNSSCDSSALLGIIVNIVDQSFISSKLQTLADQIRSYIRNDWAHCDFTEWDCKRYSSSFNLMEKLMKELSLPAADEARILGELKKWETCGMQFIEGSTLGLELVQDIYSHAKALADYVRLFANETEEAFKKVVDTMQHIVSDLADRCRKLEKEFVLFNQTIDSVKVDVVGVQGEIVNVKNEVGGVQEEVVNVKTEVACVLKEVTNVKNKVFSVLEEFGNVEKDVVVVHEDVVELQDEMNTIKRQITDDNEKIDRCQNTVHKLTANFDQMKKTNPRMKNLIHQTACSIESHTESQIYVNTSNEEDVKRILNESNLAILAAKAGSGKSTMSVHLADMYRSLGYTPVILIDNVILSMIENIDFEEMFLLIIDDLFGRTNLKFDENIHKNFLDILSNTLNSTTCKTKVILTIRQSPNCPKNILQCHTMFKSSLVVECNANLSIFEKQKLLSTHMSKFQIAECTCCLFKRECENDVVPKDEQRLQICKFAIQDIIRCDTLIGFPEACHIFCSKRNITQLGLKYFTNTDECLLNSVMELCVQGFDNQFARYQYVALVYIALKNGIGTSMRNVDDDLMKQIISKMYGENESKVKMSLLKSAVIEMIGQYVKIANRGRLCIEMVENDTDTDYYISQHTSISEAVLVSFGDECLDTVLSYCDLKFIIEYVRPRGYRSVVDQYTVFLFADESRLASKLWLKSWSWSIFSLGSYIRDIAIICTNKQFMRCFLDCITESAANEDEYSDENNQRPDLPDYYRYLLDGLSNYGKCCEFMKKYKGDFQKLAKYGSVEVTCAFCRPSSCNDTDQSTIRVNDKDLAKQLFCLIVDPVRHYDNFFDDFVDGKSLMIDLDDIFTRNDVQKIENICMYLNNIGCTPEGNAFVKLVLSYFDKFENYCELLNPWTIRSILDGLTVHGITLVYLCRVKEFCQNYLFKYGGIDIILKVCRPRSMVCDDQEVIFVDDKLLVNKLMDQLTYTHYDDADEKFYSSKDFAMKYSNSYQTKPSFSNFKYVFYEDKEYFDWEFLSDIGNYIYQYGVKIGNGNLVKMVCSKICSFDTEDDDAFDLYTHIMSRIYGPPELPDLSDSRLQAFTEGLTDGDRQHRCKTICKHFPDLAETLHISYDSDEEEQT